MPPLYAATGLSVNSTIAYCSGAGVFPPPLPGVALAIPVSTAPKTNIIPIVMALALARCADMTSPPPTREPRELAITGCASATKALRQIGLQECVLSLLDNVTPFRYRLRDLGYAFAVLLLEGLTATVRSSSVGRFSGQFSPPSSSPTATRSRRSGSQLRSLR